MIDLSIAITPLLTPRHKPAKSPVVGHEPTGGVTAEEFRAAAVWRNWC